MTKADYLRDPVTITPNKPLRLSAEAMRALKKATGQQISDLANGDDEADRLQVLAFAELHRRAALAGHMPDAGALWEAAGLVEIDFQNAEPLDPLDGGSSTISPPSAASGG